MLLYRAPEEIARTVVVVGSHDPMLDLLGQYLAVRFPGYRLASANVGSLGGLVAQKRGEAHLSGTHLLDPETGDYNLSYIRRTLGDMPVRVVTFAHREQGLIVAAGNPLEIASLDDLPRVRYRQPPARARARACCWITNWNSAASIQLRSKAMSAKNIRIWRLRRRSRRAARTAGWAFAARRWRWAWTLSR